MCSIGALILDVNDAYEKFFCMLDTAAISFIDNNNNFSGVYPEDNGESKKKLFYIFSPYNSEKSDRGCNDDSDGFVFEDNNEKWIF